MNGEEKALSLALKHQARVQHRAYARVKKARKALLEADNCTHPEEHRVDYRWEHDNGYGRQKWITGVRCELCGAKQSWKSMNSNWWKEQYD